MSSSPSSLLCIYDHCNEDRYQFVSFFPKWGEFIRRYVIAVNQQFEPSVTFVKFLKGSFDLADKIGIRLCPACFTIVRHG
jgi:hypothetical protein